MLTLSSSFMSNLGAALANYFNTTGRIFIYKGTKPTNLQSTPFNISTHSANQLIAFNTTNTTFQSVGSTLAFSVAPASAAATASGTASWAAVCNATSGTPSHVAVGDVSLNGGTGIVFLPTLTIVSGTSYSILECSWTFSV
jgi:hypothetical protein